MRALLLASLIVFTTYAASVCRAGDCQSQAMAAVSKYGIKDLKLFGVDRRGENNSKALLFWYESSRCGSTGYINVTTNENCYVNEVFTRYKCIIPGLAHYF